MPWHAKLQLDYSRDTSASSAAPTPRTTARFLHNGPLRILQSLYPEGDAVCHNVLVHPPGGIVGGDTLDIRVSVGEGAHGLVTTPGATRFYRSAGEEAVQQVSARLAPGARLEWLPLEAIAYSDCRAHNRLSFELAPGAEMIGADVIALGLPHANQPFVKGVLQQHLEIPGVWLERGRIEAKDAMLLDGALGLDGHRCLATLFFATGEPIDRARREAALDLTRELLAASPLVDTAGVTAPNDRVIVLRVLAPVVEPAWQTLRQVWQGWRGLFWGITAVPPRIWST